MPDPVSAKLRDLVFSLSPSRLKLTPLPGGVWAGVMEFEVSGTWVTLAAIADGTTSLYFGTGGGIIGSGGKAEVRKASQAFLDAMDRDSAGFAIVTSFPLPAAGRVHFYALKADGVYASADVDEQTVREPGNPLLPLYAAGQDVITQLRLMNIRTN